MQPEDVVMRKDITQLKTIMVTSNVKCPYTLHSRVDMVNKVCATGALSVN